MSNNPYIAGPNKNKLNLPEPSEWKCYMFGSRHCYGLVYRPNKGNVPNRFARFMMKICFACEWEKS